MKKIELMSRHEAEDTANKMCQDCPECEYVVYGWQRKQSKKPIFQSPIAMTANQVNNMRNQYKDVFAIRNPYHKENIMEANKEKKLYRYEGALLDMSLDKPFMYTKKPYYVQAYSPKQAILLIKKEIAKDIGVDVDDFHLTQLNLYEVSDDAQEEPAIADFDTCPLCGRRLNDGGTCPVCDDGEEDYESLQTSPEECEACHVSDKAEELEECDNTPSIKESITVAGEVLKGDPNIDPNRVFDWDTSPDAQLQKDADDLIAYMIKNNYIPFEIECRGLEIFSGDVKTNYIVEIPSKIMSLKDAGSQVLEYLLETGPAFQEPFTIKDVKEFLDHIKKDIPDLLYDENEDRILEVAEEEYDPYADWESFWEYGGDDD